MQASIKIMYSIRIQNQYTCDGTLTCLCIYMIKSVLCNSCMLVLRLCFGTSVSHNIVDTRQLSACHCQTQTSE